MSIPWIDLLWFDTGLVVSSITCNPLLSYVMIAVFYACYYQDTNSMALIGAFGGVCMGLFFRKVYKWTPYWDGNGLFIIGHCALFILFAHFIRLDSASSELHIVLYVVAQGIFLLPNDREIPRLLTLAVFTTAWSYWEDTWPHLFKDFYRIYILCVTPFVLIILSEFKVFFP
jgi:hypothetical protein